MPATDGTWRRIRFGHAPTETVMHRIAWTSVGLAVSATTLLFVRRLSGALVEPLPPALLVATAIIALAWAGAIRLFAWKPERVLLQWLPPIVLVSLAVACSYPGGRVVDWLVWAIVLAAYGLLSRAVAHPTILRRPSVKARLENMPSAQRDDQVLQQLSRIRTADGSEAVHGTLTAEFAPGERNVTLYAAFCPPFEQLPLVEAEADEAAATVKVSQVLHNGVRLDLRLARPATEKHLVRVELSAIEHRE